MVIFHGKLWNDQRVFQMGRNQKIVQPAAWNRQNFQRYIVVFWGGHQASDHRHLKETNQVPYRSTQSAQKNGNVELEQYFLSISSRLQEEHVEKESSTWCSTKNVTKSSLKTSIPVSVFLPKTAGPTLAPPRLSTGVADAEDELWRAPRGVEVRTQLGLFKMLFTGICWY